jgi:putative tricarboxylic transport membrane protein
MKLYRSLVGVVVMFTVCSIIGGTAFGWTPSKPVEFVVPAAPGGGSDVLARTIGSIIEAEKLAPVPFMVVNHPGGSATVGMIYVAQQRGNPLVLMTYHSGMVVAPLSAGLESATYQNYTLLASLAIDEQLILVKADSPYKTVKDLVTAAKEKTGGITVAGTATGQDDHICNRLFERAAGIKLRYVSFNSGGEAMTALLGGHVELIWANPSEFAPQFDAKQVRLLAVAKEERLPYLNVAPTFREQGYDVTWKMFRGINAPAGIPKESVVYYENLLKQVNDSARWKDGYLKKYMLTESWMGGQELTSYVGQQEQTSKAILKDLGLLK